jgi:hypothetical protein
LYALSPKADEMPVAKEMWDALFMDQNCGENALKAYNLIGTMHNIQRKFSQTNAHVASVAVLGCDVMWTCRDK